MVKTSKFLQRSSGIQTMEKFQLIMGVIGRVRFSLLMKQFLTLMLKMGFHMPHIITPLVLGDIESGLMTDLGGWLHTIEWVNGAGQSLDTRNFTWAII